MAGGHHSVPCLVCTQRSNGSATYRYWYNDSGLLLRMEKGNTVYSFTYDPAGHPVSVTEGNDTYYYILNQQGDVVAIINGNGDFVVEYYYDAWGRLLSTTGTAASTLGLNNPLRYRGYVYDTETGLYYLQSRYYNPTWGRFINADAFLSTGHGALGHNMFAYCNNNPVNFIDPDGTFPWLVATIMIGFILMILSDSNQVPKYEAEAERKYNADTISFLVNEVGTDANKLNVTFYPNKGLIHIENSYSIQSKYEKLAVINTIMASPYYDPNVYGNSVEKMLMEWSGHNFVYRTASASKLMYKFYQSRGYDDPIKSTRGVDFRKTLEPSAERNYEWVTLWGLLQW